MTPVAGQQFGYAFDSIGNRTQTEAGGDQTGASLRVAHYTNNPLNQITSRDVPGYVDIMGDSLATNTVSVTVGGNNQPAYQKVEYYRAQLAVPNTTGPQWPMVTVSAPGQASVTGHVYVAQTPENYSYDADGNLLSDGRWNYTWDAENRLTGMTSLLGVPAGSQCAMNFVYDDQGRRTAKMVSTNNGAGQSGGYTNYYLYDGWNCLAILNSSLSLLNSFVWGSDLSGSMQGAGGVGGLIQVSYYGTATTNCFVAYDGNGNVSALVNAADGTTLANYEYGPFGEVIRATGPMAKLNPFRFSTKYCDDETGLDYYGYRYYNPSTGRWIGRDPAGEDEGGPNLYAILCNDPIDDLDCLGLVDYKFEITEGGWGGWAGGAGAWGQPWWCASGMALNLGAQAYSSVTITSRNNPGGSCNSVDKPDPAGTIKLYLKNDCPGKFLVSINYTVQLSGTGPQGIFSATATLTGGGQTLVSAKRAPFSDSDLGDFTASVKTTWTLVSQYTPTISLHMDHGKQSTSTAYGMIQFISAIPQ
jgi:RHS repeat-associated protein